MKKQWLGVISGLIVLAILPVWAQEPPPCNGLDEAACGIWQSAVAATREAGTVAISGFTLDGEFTSDQGVSELLLSGNGQAGFAENGGLDRLSLMLGGSVGGEYQEGELRWVEEQLFFGSGDDWITPASSSDDEALRTVITGEFVVGIFTQPGVLTYQRGNDKELDGQVMVVVEGTGTFSAFLATPAASQWIELLMSSLPANQRQEIESVTGGDISSMIPLLAAFATEDRIETRIWIGAEDQLIHHIELVLDFRLEAPQEGTFGISLNTLIDLAEHGASVDITAPENPSEEYIDLNVILNELMGSGFAGGGQTVAPAEVEFTLSYGETVTGTLERNNSEDRWGFVAEAGDVVTITLRAADISTGLDTVLYLIAPDGTQIASNDDHESMDVTLDVFDSQIAEFTLPGEGGYQIVATWQAELRGAADYELTLELVE